MKPDCKLLPTDDTVLTLLGRLSDIVRGYVVMPGHSPRVEIIRNFA